jgi:hypothetical protein
MKSHGGLPQGSTCGLGSALEIYYQANTGESVELWPDQSANANNAEQTTEGNQPTVVAGGGLDFEDTDNPDTASMMDFTEFTVGANTDFLTFIVMKTESNGPNAYLSDGASEVFQQTNINVMQFKTPASTNSMNHNASFTMTTGEKALFMTHRTNGSTGTIKLYRNGLEHDPSVTDATTFDLENLGSKNDASNWFDGIIYDVGVINGARATVQIRNLITDYLCSKHGIQKLA